MCILDWYPIQSHIIILPSLICLILTTFYVEVTSDVSTEQTSIATTEFIPGTGKTHFLLELIMQ